MPLSRVFDLRRHRYGRYKFHLVLASLHSIVCFASLICSWDGNSNFWSSFLIFSGGFGTGIAHSAVFVALANGVDAEDTAIASSGFYLSGNIGLLTGISAGSAIQQITLRRGLRRVLEGRDDAGQVSHRILLFNARPKLTPKPRSSKRPFKTSALFRRQVTNFEKS